MYVNRQLFNHASVFLSILVFLFLVSCTQEDGFEGPVNQELEQENVISSRSTGGCNSNVTCIDNSWCYCGNFNYPGQTGTVPCTYTLNNKCQVSEAFSDFLTYAAWPERNHYCNDLIYLDANDCGFECCLYSNDYIGSTYADICNDLTQSMNAWVECYLINEGIITDCPDCVVTSYEPIIETDVDHASCNVSICISGMIIECCG
ncbi:MAG: hypothetical protein MI974_04455 [Chitinophagales bacterium]|nr:hypothetical protein [Chitinophagales bacterium]